MKLRKWCIAMMASLMVVFSAFCACGELGDNFQSGVSTDESSSSQEQEEKVIPTFLSYDSVDNFQTGAWQIFSDTAGDNAVLTIYEGWIGLGDARKTGKFLKFTLGAGDRWDHRAAFTTTKPRAEVVAELEMMKAQGYTGISTEIYTMYDNIWFMSYGGAYTNYEIVIHGLVWPMKWTTFTYDIDDLIQWYSDDRIGLEKEKMPLVGFGNDNRRYGEVVLTEFVYVK